MFEINDSVMKRLREEAHQRGTTVAALIEAGICYVLAEDVLANDPEGDLPPLPSWNSGGQLVDISNREELYRVMEED